MKRNAARLFAIVAAVMLMSTTVLEMSADARAGGGRSMGSRGSRSYSNPIGSSMQGAPYRQQQAPSYSPTPMQQPQQSRGGFLRSMAGGIAGGLLGGMLFRGLAGAGGMGFGGGGIGLFEIVLLAGIAYLVYRFVSRRRDVRRAPESAAGAFGDGTRRGNVYPAEYAVEPSAGDPAAGMSHLRRMDPAFEESRFKDLVMDMFFKVQGGWMNRDMAALNPLLTDEMRGVFREDVERLLRERRINRLENIAVRSVEISEVWQEAGLDYITVLIYANLLDYTTDETGAVVSGSRSEPVKFEEYWTFTRPVGNNAWRLAAIDQK